MSSKIEKGAQCFFVGNEVEHTPFFGLRTLFVSGINNWKEMIEYAEKYKCEHIYLGANNSFRESTHWNRLVPYLLGKGYKVTLDYPIKFHTSISEILGHKLMQSENFARIASCTLEDVENVYMNMLIKIDGRSNTGVWVVPVRELLNEDRKTDWIDYESDEVIG